MFLLSLAPRKHWVSLLLLSLVTLGTNINLAASFTIGVIGSSGRVGSRIVENMSEKLTKNASNICVKEIHRYSLQNHLCREHDHGGVFTNLDVLVCCLGSGHLTSKKSFNIDGQLIQKVINRAHQEGINHICLLSSIGVDDFDTKWDEQTKKTFDIKEFISDKPGNMRPEVLHWKRESEEHLRATTGITSREEKLMTHSILRLPYYILTGTTKNQATKCHEFPSGTFSAMPQKDISVSLDSVAQYVSDDILRASMLIQKGYREIIGSKTVELSGVITSTCR